MKFTKLSLIAAVAASTAFAGGDIAPVEPAPAAAPVSTESTITGEARLWYQTMDRGANLDLFSKDGSAADAALRLDYSRTVLDGAVKLNAGIQMLSTLGLENELISDTFVGHGPAAVSDAVWADIFNAEISLGNTAVVVGRQAIDTPFLYTETWNIARNTFDGVVVANSDIQDTTLVGAWVGRGNGTPGYTVMADNTSLNGGMNAFSGDNPAYAFGAVTKLIPNTTAQAWYYKIPGVADAYWLQADANIEGVQLGAQYAGTITNTSAIPEDTSAWAVKLGYGMENLNVWGAYSVRDDANGIDISNIATGHTMGSQSKLYTEAYWAYGYVGARDAQTYAIGGDYNFGFATVKAQYTDMTSDFVSDMNEFYIGTGIDLGPVDAELAYTSTALNGGDRFNTVIVMLNMPFAL